MCWYISLLLWKQSVSYTHLWRNREKWEVPKEFMDMVCADIQRITGSLNLSTGDKLKLHRELDGRYQACIKDWYVGLWGSNPTGTSVWYGFLENSPTSIGENLDMMKAKLEAYKFQMNAVHTETPTQQINVTTNVNVSITFEEVRSKIEDMTALSLSLIHIFRCFTFQYQPERYSLR